MTNHDRRFLRLGLETLADDTRLRMVGLLHAQERSVRELAGLLGVREPTVSHHLGRLKALRFVEVRKEGTRRLYRTDPERLARFKELVARLETLAPEVRSDDDGWIEALGLSPEDAKVLRDYTVGGRLKQIPTKMKKRLVVLEWLVSLFPAGALLSEAEVNETLARVHDDTSSLRRYLIELGYLRRERGGGRYWRPGEADAPGP